MSGPLPIEEDSLAGRVALVTGRTRGIGATISLSLVRRGAAVAAGYSSNRGAAVAFREPLRQAGDEASIHQGNVGDPEDCRRVVGEVIERYGRLDILVNNAGVTVDRPVSTMTVDDWYKVLRVNLSGAFICASRRSHICSSAAPDGSSTSPRSSGRRQHRPGQLRRLEVRAAGTHKDARAGNRVRA
jgi:NAD(P)-dependent dehydrogenase (short-subunit alcohol dehydrogenase family)